MSEEPATLFGLLDSLREGAASRLLKTKGIKVTPDGKIRIQLHFPLCERGNRPQHPRSRGSNKPIPWREPESGLRKATREARRLDWKSALVTFAIIFFAELGDKTQLMVMSISAGSRSPQMVFMGAAAALITSCLVAVMAGDALLKAVPLRTINLATGIGFLVIGAIFCLRAIR